MIAVILCFAGNKRAWFETRGKYDEIPFMVSPDPHHHGFDHVLHQRILNMFLTKPTTHQYSCHFESEYYVSEDLVYVYFSMHDTINPYVQDEVMRDKHCELLNIDEVVLSPQAELWIKEIEEHECFQKWDIHFNPGS